MDGYCVECGVFSKAQETPLQGNCANGFINYCSLVFASICCLHLNNCELFAFQEKNN